MSKEKVLKNNWKILKFSECIEQLNTGLNPRNHFSLGKGNIKYITAKNLTKLGTIDFSKCDFIDEKAKCTINRRSDIKVGDILFSSRAPIGHCHLIKDEPNYFDIGESIFSIRVNKEIVLPEYLCLYLSSDYFIKLASKNTTGSIIQEIRISDLMNTDIIIPPKDTQKYIAESILNIDKKIELNNKINFELEAMAKTIYDYWFLQFEFPNEEGKPYKSSGGKMVWNDELKREIPEGWEVRKLEDIFSFEKGRTPKILYPVYQEGLIPYITIDVANNNKAQFCDLENMILCKEEVIMVMDGAASGDIYIGNTGAIGSTFSVLRIKRDDISNSLLYCLLNSLKGIYKKVNTGSTVPHANKKYIESMYIPLAKNMEKFSKTFENFYVQIIKNRKENQELASLRDFLLPLLMNGQVGFKEK